MPNVISKEDCEFLLDCIGRNRWSWASTMPTIPHEYIVRKRCSLSHEEFDKFVILQRNHGIHMKWGRYNFPYLHVDGYKYWTMGAPINETVIINRQKLFDEYNAIAPIYDSLFQDEQFKKEDEAIANKLDGLLKGTIFEIGCGTGKLIEKINIDANYYTGIDPSKSMLSIFHNKFPEFQSHTINKAFEEYEFKKRFDWCVSLYGSMSYIMSPYIRRIEDFCDRYFLMFYAPNYTPVTYVKSGVKMHHFNYSVDNLRQLLPSARLFRFNNYIVAQKE